MLVNFDALEDSARLFLYPSNKKFYPELFEEINSSLNQFITEWCFKHHIEAGYTIKHLRFILIAINPNSPVSTLVIDELVSFIFKLQSHHQIELLDKLNVCFKQGEHVQYKEVKDFKKMIKNRSVNENTVVFDHLINTKGELESNWELPAKESWYSRMF